MADEESGGRMTNFSPEERAVIVEGLSQHGDRLYGPQSAFTGKADKLRIFAEITAQVNALGVAEREPKHIRKKINDLRRLVKEKLVAKRKHASGTGGGPAKRITLTAEDLVVARFLARELVEGLEGFDSGDQPLRRDVQDGAGPSSAAGQPTTSRVETAPTSVMEEVEEEQVVVEEETLYLLVETPSADPSQTSPLIRVSPSGLSIPIRDSPSRDPSPSRASPSRDPSPSRASPSRDPSPSRASPSTRPQAAPAPRKALKKRGESLQSWSSIWQGTKPDRPATLGLLRGI